jgi:ectoine hydroxylase-related dioxygenase (phytanoyl-CoA dioxygenase family)
MQLTADQIAQYREQGYLLLPNVFNPEDLTLIKRNLKALAIPGGEGVVMEDNGLIRALHGCHLNNEYFDQLIRDPRCLGPARQVLEADVYIHQFKINVKAAFGGDVWPWHQDYIFWRKGDGIPTPNLVNISIFLDDITQFNGPLFFIPSSHHQGIIEVPPNVGEEGGWEANVSAKLKYTVPNHVIADLEKRHGMVAATGGAGTLLLFHPNMIHGSVPNISPYDRELLLLTYNHIANQSTGVPNPRPEFLATRHGVAL